MRMARIVTVIGLATGCAQVASDDVKTAGIQAAFVALSDGDGHTSVSGTLQVGYDFVKLSSGDTLTLRAGSQSQPMAEDTSIIGSNTFAAQLGTDAPGTQITVALTRTGETSAPSSTVTLPSRFTLTPPAANQTFSRANDDLVVSWDTPAAANETMSWGSTSTCMGSVSTSASSGGTISAGATSVEIPKGTLAAATTGSTNSNIAAGNCSETITISRQITGKIDPAYAGGSIVSQRVGAVTLSSTP